MIKTLSQFQKKTSLFILFFIYAANAIGQIVVITTVPQKVPVGKKWVLSSKMSPLVELNGNALVSGSLYNAQIQSNPRLVSVIAEGDYQRPNKLYQIAFLGLRKYPYTNEFTHQISSINTFRCSNFPNTNFSTQQTITFYPGQEISVNGCLESIQMMQVPFTASELARLKKDQKLGDENMKKQIAEMRAQRSIEIMSDYKKANEDIINSIEPLRLEEININPNKANFIKGVEDDNLPHSLQVNEQTVQYKADYAKLAELLDTVNVEKHIFIRFDKKGLFKSLYDEDHNMIKLTDSLVNDFKSAISLVTPLILTYNKKSYPVEFETRYFEVTKEEGYTYKRYAFISAKKSIEFLTNSSIDGNLIRGVNAKLGQEIELPVIENSPENILHLKQLFENLLSGNEASIYSWAFRIKGDEVIFNSTRTQYLVYTYIKSIGTKLLRWGDSNELLGTHIRNLGKEEIYNVYFYNKSHDRVEGIKPIKGVY